jgi:flavodoxin
MKAIVYASVHHGNTKKVVDAIAKECEVELIGSTQFCVTKAKKGDNRFVTNFHNSYMAIPT